jgi:hypothetical protein
MAIIIIRYSCNADIEIIRMNGAPKIFESTNDAQDWINIFGGSITSSHHYKIVRLEM